MLSLPSNILLAVFNSPRAANGSFRSDDFRKKESLKYFKKGADMGDADCQYEMGLCYEKGYGVKSNLRIAKAYYTQAAAQGNAKAKNKLVIINTSPSSQDGKTPVFDFSPMRQSCS